MEKKHGKQVNPYAAAAVDNFRINDFSIIYPNFENLLILWLSGFPNLWLGNGHKLCENKQNSLFMKGKC